MIEEKSKLGHSYSNKITVKNNKKGETKTKMTEEKKAETKEKVEKKPLSDYGKTGKAYQPARIELRDGTVVAGIRFLRDIAKLDAENSCKDYAASYWLGTTEKGVAILNKFGAKIVYKPLTPKNPPAPKKEKAEKVEKPAVKQTAKK